MKTKNTILLAGVVLSLACRGSDSKAVRKDQQYDVVQEGQASGVTSTINGPGETASAAAVPLTGTNADTTTNFALPADGAMTGAPQGQPGSIAGTLPATSGAPMPGQAVAPTTAPPHAQMPPRVASAPQSTERPMNSASTYTPRPARQPVNHSTTVMEHTTTSEQSAPVNTSAAPPPAPATDTTTSANKNKSDEKSEKTDTSSSPQPTNDTPPPPPPPNGQQ